MLNGKRPGDANDAIYFRADRVTRINGKYFFATREGTLEGPYESQREACEAIEVYIRRMTSGQLTLQPKTSSSWSGLTLSLCDY